MSRIERIETLLEKTPNDAFLTHALALEYTKLNHTIKAIDCFEKNLHLKPDYLATYYHLGKAYELLPKLEAAKDIYLKGMQLAKNQNDIKTYQELQNAYDSVTEEY